MENKQIQPEKKVNLISQWKKKRKEERWYYRLGQAFRPKKERPDPAYSPLETRTTEEREHPGIEPTGYVPLIETFFNKKKKDTHHDKRPRFLEGLVAGAAAAFFATVIGFNYGNEIKSYFLHAPEIRINTTAQEQSEHQTPSTTETPIEKTNTQLPTPTQQKTTGDPQSDTVPFTLPDIIYLDVKKGDTASKLYQEAITVLRQGKRPYEDSMASMLYRPDGLITTTEDTYGLDLERIKPGDRIPLDLNLLPHGYQVAIDRTRTLSLEKKPLTKTRRQLITDYLQEHAIPVTSSLLDGKEGLEERLTSFNKTLSNYTSDEDNFYLDPVTIKKTLEERMANYLSSLREIGERYSQGESASAIAKDYALPELQNLDLIRQIGWNRVRHDGSIRAYDRHMFKDADQTFADLYAQHGTYKKVKEALAEQGVKVHTSTIGRHVRAYKERFA